MADMENYKKFWESVTGRKYGSPPPPQKKNKTKTTMNRRGGDGTEKTEVQT